MHVCLCLCTSVLKLLILKDVFAPIVWVFKGHGIVDFLFVCLNVCVYAPVCVEFVNSQGDPCPHHMAQ